MTATDKKRARWFAGILIVYLLTVFAFSHLPGSFWAKTGIRFWDKAVHAAEYLPVGFLLLAWLIHLRPSWRVRRALALVFPALAFLAGFDEAHQYFVPGRQASFGDFAADIIGGASGALAAALVFMRRVRARMGENRV